MSDYLNSLISDWTVVVKSFTVLAAIVVIVVVAIVTRLAWGRILVTMIVAGLVVWAVTGNGLGWFSSKVGEESNKASGITSQIVDYDLAA